MLARIRFAAFVIFGICVLMQNTVFSQRPQKPVLYGKHWVAVTGKPIAATAGAMIFQKGGNAVDAACAMIAATSTMWDTLSWGGETQADAGTDLQSQNRQGHRHKRSRLRSDRGNGRSLQVKKDGLSA